MENKPLIRLHVRLPVALLLLTGINHLSNCFGQRLSPYHHFHRQRLQLEQGHGQGQARKLVTLDIISNVTAERPIWNPEDKPTKICNIMGGLDLTRLKSFRLKDVFKDGIEDVELMREVITESIVNGGLRGGLSDLDEMAQTLDWQARNLSWSANLTTYTAGMGWVDDRVDRRGRRQVTTPNQPLVGSKQADAVFSDTLSNVLPWIRDRRAKETKWYMDHQNGRTEGISKSPLKYDSLYIGVWMVTHGDAVWYYPPMSAFAHPYTFSDIVGGDYDWRIFPAEPLGWPFEHVVRGGDIKDALYDPPYADVAHPGLSMISAIAPVYYTGEWYGYQYDDTFLGTVGVDIALDSIANVLNDLEDTLTEGSFALLADANTFKIIAMSQSVVNKIYPPRTGMEEERVTYHDVDGSIVEDRRNQTYKVSDTIWQGLLDGVESANWQLLRAHVQNTELGGRGYTQLNVTLTGQDEAEQYYAMFDRWEAVAEWVVLVLVPVKGVDHAIAPEFATSQVELEAVQGHQVAGSTLLTNHGTLNIVVSSRHSNRIQLADSHLWDKGVRIKPGENVTIEFVVDTSLFGIGNTTTPISFHVQDDDYPDCLHSGEISFQVSLQVSPEPNLNHLGSVRIGGLFLCAIVMATSLAFIFWVIVFRKMRVVVASQPLFLIMISMGCCILASSIIPLSIDDEVASLEGCDTACMAWPWTASMGFVTTFSALFSKIYRVNKIFGQQRFKRIVVSEMDVMKPFLILFSLNFVVLLSWTLTDPLRWERIALGEWDSYGACRAEGDQYGTFVGLVGAINLIALVLACYQAYLAREISDEFSETKYIAIAIGSMLQITAVGLPLLFLVGDNPSANFFMQAAILFVISMAVLLLIFVPKMIYMKNYHEVEHRKKTAKQASILRRASAGSNLTHGSNHTATATDHHDASESGIMILGYGTAALRKENDELKDIVSKLKDILDSLDIEYEEQLQKKEEKTNQQVRIYPDVSIPPKVLLESLAEEQDESSSMNEGLGL